MFIRGGGLCLGSAIAIFASISSDVIAMESNITTKPKNGIHDFRSELNQIVWDASCSQEELDIKFNNEEKYSWILDDKYKDSRTKVIGKAIGDCVAGEGAFANKKPYDIITFGNTEPQDYKPENWNAVILYNYVHEAINGEAFKEFFTGDKVILSEETYTRQISDVKAVLGDKLDTITKFYEKNLIYNLDETLKNAVEDIQKYVQALKLDKYLYDFRASKHAYDKIPQCKQALSLLAPHLTVEFKEGKKEPLPFCTVNGRFGFCRATPNGVRNKRSLYEPTFLCRDGKLYTWKFIAVSQFREIDERNRYIWGCIDIHDHSTLYITQLQNGKGKWLIDRLAGLAEVPSEKLWNKWHPKNK